jgi:hypothetical protein
MHGMDYLHIDEFYDQDERRRESAEWEFGDEWSDEQGNLYELSYVEATGELYLLAEPEAPVSIDLFGDFYIGPEPLEGLTVVVVGTFRSADDVQERIDGWEEAMATDNSLAWLYQRVQS